MVLLSIVGVLDHCWGRWYEWAGCTCRSVHGYDGAVCSSIGLLSMQLPTLLITLHIAIQEIYAHRSSSSAESTSCCGGFIPERRCCCRGVQVQLVDYGLQAVTEGIEALAVTRVSIRPDGRLGNEAYVTSYQVRTALPCCISLCGSPLHSRCQLQAQLGAAAAAIAEHFLRKLRHGKPD